MHREPNRVVLSTYDDEISGGADRTLLRHVTDVIIKRATETLDVAAVKRLLETRSSVIVLDGLDEVAFADVRREGRVRTNELLLEMASMQ